MLHQKGCSLFSCLLYGFRVISKFFPLTFRFLLRPSKQVECHTKLSGVPDLTLAFSNHRLIDDASLHPCVRFLRWKRERVLSFIPPDGHFCLMNYEVNCLRYVFTLPILFRHCVSPLLLFNVHLKESHEDGDLFCTFSSHKKRQCMPLSLYLLL